jgi:Tol biopolymer transport system component
MAGRKVLLLGLAIVSFIVIVVVGFFVVRLLNQPDTVRLSQRNTDIAFVSDRDGAWGIYIINPVGEVRHLTPLYTGDETLTCTASTRGQANCTFDYFPSYSFDGEMINFLTNRQRSAMGPGQVRPDGTDFAALDILGAISAVAMDQRFDWDPQWTPDGWLGWSKIANLNLEAYIATPEGEEYRLTRDGINGARDWFTTWSPDGQILLFNSDRDGKENVYSLNRADLITSPDNPPLQQLTDNPVDDFHPSWSLDGEQILFISDLNDGLLDGLIQFYLMNPDGSDQRPLGDATFAGDAAYSADGSQMVYMSNENGTWSLYLQDIETGETQQITDDTSNDLFPVWGPVPEETPGS